MCSVTRSGTTASPAAVRNRTPRPSARPCAARVARVHLGERGLRQGRLELVGALGHPALVHQQVVGGERQPVGAGAGGGAETGVTVTSRGAHRRAISSWSSSSVSKPRSPPHGGREPREDLPVRPADPGGGAQRADALAAPLPVAHMPLALEERRGRQEDARVGPAGRRAPSTGRRRCRRSAGRGARARRRGRRGAGRPRSGRGRRARARPRREGSRSCRGRPASVITGPQTASSSARSSGTSSRRPPGPKRGVHAGRAARRDRRHGEGSTRIGRRGPARRRAAASAAPSCSASRAPARTIPRSPAAAQRGAGAGVDRCPPRSRRAPRPRRRVARARARRRRAAGSGARPRPRSGRRARPPSAGADAGSAPPARHRARRPRSRRRRSMSRYVTALGAGRRPSTLGRAAVGRPAVVQVVGPQHGTRELRQRVRVLVEQAPAREHADAGAAARVGHRGQRLAERRRLEPAIAHERRRDPAGRVVVAEREPPLVADPRVVHLGVLAREHPHDLAAPLVDAHGAPGAAVPADGVGARQVERPRDEPVGRRGQRADRADLHDVARERRAQVLAGGDRRPAPPRPARRARGTGRR